MVVAQLAEWSLLMPMICGSKPVIGNIRRPLFTANLVRKKAEKTAILLKNEKSFPLQVAFTQGFLFIVIHVRLGCLSQKKYFSIHKRPFYAA